MLLYPKMICISPKNQDKTKENQNNDVYETNENNHKVTRHKKINIRVINVRRKKNLKKRS